MRNKSFTLIELLVVIVIIGILTGVIMISTSSSIDKASIAKSKVFEESVQNNLAANMVSRWKLDGNANDSWGNRYGTATDITFANESQCVTGVCASFNGLTSYIDCGNVKIGDNDFAVSVWAKSNGFISGAGIVGKKSWYNNNGNGFFIAYPSSPQDIYVGVTEELTYRAPNMGLGPVFDWNHITLIRNKNRVNVYLNGNFKAYSSVQTSSSFDSDRPILIGKNEYTGKIFNGLIDDVRIYNAALSSSQIKQNYIAGLNSMLANGNISKKEYNQRINNLSIK
ncbi:MAG TPA: prepilin-type N-terminal cleavage/methylation domain-containing protein [Candidatus Pacearchaeota archaeon]|nr:prepilin-type N-terminal cleavage/methylation domain-containing protein [Candidatus Pacearchaeota archaeon]